MSLIQWQWGRGEGAVSTQVHGEGDPALANFQVLQSALGCGCANMTVGGLPSRALNQATACLSFPDQARLTPGPRDTPR
jgi:hypothetical protein